jgi:uncharacterized sulfatase
MRICLWLIVAILPLFPSSGSASGSPATEKPNFVFILIDDLGYTDLGIYGSRFHETPRIDRLAQEGMRFTAGYAASPVCSPTRASILTGQYPARWGLNDFIPGHRRPFEKLVAPVNRRQYLPLEAVTFAEAIKAAGYTSGAFGKWHLGDRNFYPDRQGFDSMLVHHGSHFGFETTPPRKFPKGAYLSEVLTDEAVEFIKVNKERPFCLYLMHYAVHIPLLARTELIDKYRRKPKPVTGVNHPVYAAMVEHVDASVGRILDALENLELDRRTVVMFFSDNGGLRRNFKNVGPIVSSNAPMRAEKGTLYEGGIRVPLIVRWPGVVEAGSVESTPVSSIDLYPTILEIAGVNPAPRSTVDGESLLPLLSQEGDLQRDTLYWHYPAYHHSRPAGAVRQGRWKLIEFFDDEALELYDLEVDVGETKNLARVEPEKARSLEKKLSQWRSLVNADMPKRNRNYDQERAKEWGVRSKRN